MTLASRIESFAACAASGALVVSIFAGCQQRRPGEPSASSSAAAKVAAPSGTPPDEVLPPTFATLKLVLNGTTPPCNAMDCHGPGGPNKLQYNLKDPDQLYETLTTHVSVECGNIPVVTPGAPEKSALVKVLKGPCSQKLPQMPNGCSPEMGNCLPANYVAAIEQWIKLGAPKE